MDEQTYLSGSPAAILKKRRGVAALRAGPPFLELVLARVSQTRHSGLEETKPPLWSGGVKWNENSLTKECRAAAKLLSSVSGLDDFYLAGGTALALWCGHRISVDLDFFSETNPLQSTERQTLIRQIVPLAFEIEEEKDGTLHARYKTAHISFFRYPYPLLKPTKRWGTIRVADPLDIGLMKLGAIIGRGSKKDFYDVATLMTNGVSLKRLFRTSKRKFKGHRDFWLQASRALVYFTDAEKDPQPRLNHPLRWSQVKRMIQSEVRSVVNSKLK